MLKQQRMVIVGGSSTIAEHCARLWLHTSPSCHLILVGRDRNRLERVSNDLMVRTPSAKIDIKIVDFTNHHEIQNCIDSISAQGDIDIGLIAHGFLPNQSECENQSLKCEEALQINGVSAVLFTELISKLMINQKHGKLGVIGSVAGDRGRKSNYVYGAAKSLIHTYVEGIQHKLALINSDVTLTLVKPGPTMTRMTSDLTNKGKMATPDQVAGDIVCAINQGKRVIYTPGKWQLIMFIIKRLPMFIFGKIDI